MQPAPARTPWRVRLAQAVRDSKIEVIGQLDVKNEPHADAAIAVLRAYGHDHAGFVYIEPYLAKRATRPNDVLICHPELGVLVVEVKGYGIESILRVAAGNLFIRTPTQTSTQNPFNQAETSMFDIKTAFERSGRPRAMSPIFEFVVALPRISSADWAHKGFDQSLDRSHLLFKDDLENTTKLRAHLKNLVKQALELHPRPAPIDPNQIPHVKAIFGDSAVINPLRQPREPVPDETIGAMIEWAENADKNLSPEQQELSRLEVGSHPRVIRGVAGSGKTIVLANMVARYIRRAINESEAGTQLRLPRIAIVCYNRSLVPFLRRRVSDSFGDGYDDLALAKPVITHLRGLFRRLTDVEHRQFARDEQASVIADHYRRALTDLKSRDLQAWDRNLFDAVFIDEGQDLEPDEYRLLTDLVRPNPKTSEKPIQVFYDNAQNLYARTQPTWSDLGIDVARGDRSRVMKQCFRNTKQILELGFNVLYGSKARGPVRTRTFLDVETLRNNRLITEDRDYIKVHFAEREGADPVVKVFDNRQTEIEWIVSEIRRLVEEQFVRISDILVLFRTEVEYDAIPDLVKVTLSQASVQGFIRIWRKSEDRNSYILRENHLTLSTIHSAKGYDAPIVFLAGVDRLQTENHDRALFYVGATRAKHVLYVSGVKTRTMNGTLLAEAQLVHEDLVKPASQKSVPDSELGHSDKSESSHSCAPLNLHD